MTAPAVVAAVDLGASGGRVIAARVSGSGVDLHEVSRFPNEPVLAGGTLYWDILRLHGSVLAGLSAAAAAFPLAGVGIDAWGVDYGLLDAAGTLIGNPVHYRDSRTDGVTSPVPAAELYAVTGIQHLPFNTIYQLAAAAGTPELAAARTLLLIPDLKDLRTTITQDALSAGRGYREATARHAFTEPGRGDVDFAAVLKVLSRFAGWYVVEVDIPDQPTAQDTARLSAQWVREHLAGQESADE